MKDKKKEDGRGRPRVSPNSRPMKITLPQDDWQLLRDICDLTGGTVSGMVRELIAEGRPHLLGIREALKKAKDGQNQAAIDMLARVGASSILKLLEEPSVQQEFEALSKKGD